MRYVLESSDYAADLNAIKALGGDGITTPSSAHRRPFHDYAALGRDLRAACPWRVRWSVLLRGPGYNLEG